MINNILSNIIPNKRKTRLPQQTYKLLPTILLGLGLISFQVHALPTVSATAHPPHRIKPGISPLFVGGLTPTQVKTAYGFIHLPFHGEGQTIGIIDAYDHPNIEADLEVFNKNFGLAECTTKNGCFSKVYASGKQPQTHTGWALETSLDVEWAHGIAPNAKILLVEATDNSLNALFDAIDVAIKKGATVISMSWGSDEFAGEAPFDQIFSAPHVTFTASSGDGGTGVLYPASSPYVIAVGGTSLSIDSVGNYRGETAWEGSGGGVSVYQAEPAYQSTFGIPNDTGRFRGVPDVSYNADPDVGFSVYDSVPIDDQSGWFVVGGTSAGAPQWAALIAIAKSGAKKPLTGVNTLLYNIAKKKYASTYTDINTGTNGPCGYFCTARKGYDYVTGLGSPQALYLVNELVATKPIFDLAPLAPPLADALLS